VALDPKVLHDHVLVADEPGVGRPTRRIDGTDDFLIYVNVAKTSAVGARGTIRRRRVLPPFFLGRDIPCRRTARRRGRRRLTLELANALPQALILLLETPVLLLETAVLNDNGFHEIQHLADDFTDLGVSQSLSVKAKFLHIFNEVGGTHDIGILCPNSPKKYLDCRASNTIACKDTILAKIPHPCHL
jgi:hypothetical protein